MDIFSSEIACEDFIVYRLEGSPKSLEYIVRTVTRSLRDVLLCGVRQKRGTSLVIERSLSGSKLLYQVLLHCFFLLLFPLAGWATERKRLVVGRGGGSALTLTLRVTPLPRKKSAITYSLPLLRESHSLQPTSFDCCLWQSTISSIDHLDPIPAVMGCYAGAVPRRQAPRPLKPHQIVQLESMKEECFLSRNGNLICARWLANSS